MRQMLVFTTYNLICNVDYSAHVCYHFYTQEETENEPKPLVVENLQPKVLFTNAVEIAHPTMDDKIRVGSDSYTRQRLIHALDGVAWPVLQAGLSTILGIFPLILVDAYVVAVFWKTIILVTVLGMYHALLLLPIVFIRLSRLNFRSRLRQCWNRKQ